MYIWRFYLVNKHTFSSSTPGSFMTFFPCNLSSYWELPFSLPPLASFYCCSFSCEASPLHLSAAPGLPFLWLYLCLLLSTPKQLVLAGLKPCFVLLNQSKCTHAFKSFSAAYKGLRNWSFEVTFAIVFDDVCL